MRSPCIQPLAVLALPLLLAAAGCKDDESSPTAPSAVTGTGGVGQIRGTERLAWNQGGDVARLKFRAYVDDRAVDLPGATCTASGTEAECHSPLPPLSDGVHTIALVNVTIGTGAESERTAALTVQKVSARASVSSLPLASARSGGLRLDPVITLADDLSFTADIVATGVRAPAQMAWLPDGRLLVSDADGHVRVVRPGEPEHRDPALDASMLTSEHVGPMGIASHPDFAQNRLVYLSLLERDRAGQTRLRVVRLREVGDTLGEPATVFEAPVVEDGAPQTGPRMAFGPDRLLYVMLPPGMEFLNEPAASTPRASMLRLADDGRAAPVEPLSGITATPLAFTWNAATGALWVMFRGESGETAVRSLVARARVNTMSAEAPRLRVREGSGTAAGTLLLQSAPDDLLVAQTLVGTRADGLTGLARLALPVQAAGQDGGISDRIGDVVAGEGGRLFVATSNVPSGTLSTTAGDVVVRLTPVRATR